VSGCRVLASLPERDEAGAFLNDRVKATTAPPVVAICGMTAAVMIGAQVNPFVVAKRTKFR
jgi:hypothetical protein